MHSKTKHTNARAHTQSKFFFVFAVLRLAVPFRTYYISLFRLIAFRGVFIFFPSFLFFILLLLSFRVGRLEIAKSILHLFIHQMFSTTDSFTIKMSLFIFLFISTFNFELFRIKKE